MAWKERVYIKFLLSPNLARLFVRNIGIRVFLIRRYSVAGNVRRKQSQGRAEKRCLLPLYRNPVPVQRQDTTSFRDTNDIPFKLNVRIPDWAEEGHISVNGSVIKEITEKDSSTYFTVEINEPSKTDITVYFDMPVRLTTAHPLVESNTGQVAVERGPLVYCVESQDTELETLDDLILKPDREYRPVEYEIEEQKDDALEGEAWRLKEIYIRSWKIIPATEV